jgi:acetyl/propionyl-CoA carboxylase alpha subunit
MQGALRQTVVLGLVTNLARLRAIVEHPAFAAGELHTGFIAQHLGERRPPACPPPLAVAALVAALRQPGGGGRAVPSDPWSKLGAWRLGGAA